MKIQKREGIMGKIQEKKLGSGTQLMMGGGMFVCWLSRGSRRFEKGGESVNLPLQGLGEQMEQRNTVVLPGMVNLFTISMLLIPRPVPLAPVFLLTSRPA